jgi:hypothetical protein
MHSRPFQILGWLGRHVNLYPPIGLFKLHVADIVGVTRTRSGPYSKMCWRVRVIELKCKEKSYFLDECER